MSYPPGTLLWSAAWGTTGESRGVSVLPRDGGGVVLIGLSNAEVYFGGDVLGVDGLDVFVTSLDAEGTHIASTRLYGAGSQRAFGAARDEAGNLFIAGNADDELLQDGAEVFPTNTAPRTSFVAKLDANLQQQGAAGLTSSDDTWARHVSVQAGSGDVYFVLGWRGIGGFTSGPIDVGVRNSSVLVKTSNDLTPLWSRIWQGSDIVDAERVLAVDDGVIAAGEFRGSFDPGGGSITAVNLDVWISRHDDVTDGGAAWQIHVTGTGDVRVHDIDLFANGDLLVFGAFNGNLTLAGTTYASSGGNDIFIMRVGQNGQVVWGKAYAETFQSDHFRNPVLVDAEDNVLIFAGYDGPANFGSGPLVADGRDLVYVKLDGNGSHLFSMGWSAPSEDIGSAITLDDDGLAWLTGSYQDSITFGGDTYTTDDTRRGMFLVKMAP